MVPLRAALLPVLAALALVACGESGDAGADPAAAVPAGAAVYLEATVRPGGELGRDAEALAARVLRTDDAPARLRALFDRAAREDGVAYARDVEPWLGERVGLFFTAFGADDDDFQGAIVAAVSDEDEARDALGRFGADEGESAQRTYKDVEYRVVAAQDTAFAVVDGYAVVGSESGLRGAIDAVQGDSLAESETFADAQEGAAGDSLARVHVDLPGFLTAVAGAASASDPTGALGAAQAAPLLGGGTEAVTALATVDDDVVRVETTTAGGDPGPGRGDRGVAATAMRELPAAAWAALGVGDLGGELERGLEQVAALGGLAGFDLDELLAEIERETGIDVRADVLGWMGAAGVFVEGETAADLGGGLVVASEDPAASRAAVSRIARLAVRLAPGEVRLSPLRGPGIDEGVTLRVDDVPSPIAIAAAGERFVIATAGALPAAVRPARTLGEDAAFSALAGELGDVEPTFLLRIAPPLALAGTLGAGEDPAFRQVAAILRGFTAAVAGSEREGDVARGRLVVGVR